MSGTSIVCDPSDAFEAIAASVHSAWVREAVSNGAVSHGKTDTNLKPYSALSEDLKEYTRVTVRAVLDELCLSSVIKSKES